MRQYISVQNWIETKEKRSVLEMDSKLLSFCYGLLLTMGMDGMLITEAVCGSSQAASPTVSKVGLYVNRIEKISVKEQTFDCEFYLWMKWRGEHSPKNIEFVNGSNITKRFEVSEVDSLGYHYISANLRGTFSTDLDVSRYPRDKHILTIQIENFDWTSELLVFEVDSVSSGLRKSPTGGEWKFERVGQTVKNSLFKPDSSRFSHYEFSVSIRRLVTPFVVKILIPLLIVVAMSMLTFFIPPNELEAQVGIGATSLLSIIAFHWLIGDELPDVGYLTTADVLMMGNYVVVFLALVESVMVNRIHRDDARTAMRIDQLCRWGFPCCYFLFLTILFALF